MSKRLLALLIVLAMFPSAQAVGLELMEIPTNKVAPQVLSILDFTMENRGFEKVFVTLPDGWTIDESADDHGVSNYFAYPVREEGLWRIYGLPHDRSSYLGKYESSPYLQGDVWIASGITANPINIDDNTDCGDGSRFDRCGWWLWPNQKVKVHLELRLPGQGEVEPDLLEGDYKWIRVTKWEQEFILKGSGGTLQAGYYTAPWTVKGATLTSTEPAVYAEADEMGAIGTRYYEDVTTRPATVEVPAWDEWFTLKNSVSSSLKPISIATSSVIYDVPETAPKKTPVPVFRIKEEYEIRYTYLWYRDHPVDTALEGGVQFSRQSILDVPPWYLWF
jgi:hypothetical protein